MTTVAKKSNLQKKVEKNSVEHEVESAKLQIKELAELAATITVTDADSERMAADVLARVKQAVKGLTGTKDGIIKPINVSLKNIRSLFKPAESALSEIEGSIKSKLLEYNEKIAAEARKEAERIERAAGASDKNGRPLMRTDTAMAKLSNVEQAATAVSTEHGGVQYKLGIKKVRINDVGAVITSNPEYLLRERVLDAIRIEISLDLKEGKQLPDGAETYQDKIVAGMAG